MWHFSDEFLVSEGICLTRDPYLHGNFCVGVPQVRLGKRGKQLGAVKSPDIPCCLGFGDIPPQDERPPNDISAIRKKPCKQTKWKAQATRPASTLFGIRFAPPQKLASGAGAEWLRNRFNESR